MSRPRRAARLVLTALLAALGIAGFSALGLWQIERLHWKLDLIARVDARIHVDPVPAPGAADWPGISAESAEYRRVTLSGQFLADKTVLIYTPSDYGPADWVLTPLARDDGTVVMVNRGVVPDDIARAGGVTTPEGPVTVTGLLRISEDRGWLFSRENDPAARKWYRRDIGSITETLGLSPAAPYFVDAELGDPAAWPRGGQTVVAFRNAHLSYALTWFALAAVVALGAGLVFRHELRGRG